MISSSSSASSLSSRRIKFAPLPIVTRTIDDDNDIITHKDDDDSEIIPPPTTQQLLSHQPTPHVPSWSKPKSLNLLRPFPFQRPVSTPSSDNSLTPTQSNDSSSTVNLFRASSCTNDRPASPSWGFSLTRWSSPGTSYTKGAPLSRSQSAQSNSSTLSSKFKFSTLISNPRPATADSQKSTSASRPTTPTTATRKGTRMLNGRVYGARKRDPNANPFANARDEDPEFVEWGYGGMGSVRGAQHAGVTGDHAVNNKERTRWERLQGDRAFMPTAAGPDGEKKGVGGASGGVPNAIVDEEDDGSGMGWVKKRKRERAEKEAKEKAEAGAVNATATAAAVIPGPTQPNEIENVVYSPALTVTAVSPTPTITLSNYITPLEHNLRTITVPTHLSRHRRVASRSTSADGVPTIASPQSTHGAGNHTASGTGPVSPSSSSASESESDRDDDDDDEEEEEDEGIQQRRKTALGAGVEKISRHH